MRLPSTHRRTAKTPVDVMYVGSGSTAGLRRADTEMLSALRGLGVGVLEVTPKLEPPRPTRRYVQRSLATIDAFESMALRRATAGALSSHEPRAIIYSTTHAAMLQPRAAERARVAIRFDTPARLSRSGAPYRLEHALERRRFERAALLMPSALELGPDTTRLLPPQVPVVPVPIPIELSGEPAAANRDPVAVFYAASPEKKGLDIAVRAWARVARADARGRRLVITGIDRERGLRYLHKQGIAEPPAVQWTGLLSPERHRALTRRAEVYLAASRYENYGIGQLEALADGSMLVTTPSPGPFAALPIARELDAQMVAAGDSPAALAAALETAFARGEDERVSYRAHARERLRAFSHEETSKRLRDAVLPLLLS
ncbi:MAG TPA: glycosyltransferase [Solirubrobacteraceae bacterium]|nr:glycosyltransferase [Solirubrobacteraceae bacterium]